MRKNSASLPLTAALSHPGVMSAWHKAAPMTELVQVQLQSNDSNDMSVCFHRLFEGGPRLMD